MCSSAIYAANTSAQTVAAATATTINFGQVIRRFGNYLELSGGNVATDGAGYYDVNASVDFTAAAGEVTIQVLQDGVPVTGAEAVVTATAATNYSVTIPCIIRNKCCCSSTITVVMNSVGASAISNAAITVSKL